MTGVREKNVYDMLSKRDAYLFMFISHPSYFYLEGLVGWQ